MSLVGAVPDDAWCVVVPPELVVVLSKCSADMLFLWLLVHVPPSVICPCAACWLSLEKLEALAWRWPSAECPEP